MLVRYVQDDIFSRKTLKSQFFGFSSSHFFSICCNQFFCGHTYVIEKYAYRISFSKSLWSLFKGCCLKRKALFSDHNKLFAWNFKNCSFIFPNNNKWLPLCCIVLGIPELLHCEKNVRIWSYSGPHFFRIFSYLDWITERYGVNLELRRRNFQGIFSYENRHIGRFSNLH